MINIKRVDHVSINAKDFEASAKFYSDLMGFKRMETVDLGDFSITYFAIPGGTRLELFDYRGINPDRERLEDEVGLRHLAFEVEDVAAHETLLRQKGVPITLPTIDLSVLGVRVCLFTDPAGTVLEICEPIR
jgi:catechol 2,3-dioxygenase-like lactoylglutathione lyase family enzyme